MLINAMAVQHDISFGCDRVRWRTEFLDREDGTKYRLYGDMPKAMGATPADYMEEIDYKLSEDYWIEVNA